MIPIYARSGGRSGSTAVKYFICDTDLTGYSSNWVTGATDTFYMYPPYEYWDVTTIREIMPLEYCNWWDWYRWTPEYPPEKLMVRGQRVCLPVKRIIK